MKSMLARVAIGMMTAGLLGCTTSGQIASQIVKTNVAQETAENQLLLLNVLRAYKRRPMHFTQVTAVHLPVGVGNPNFQFALPFGGDPKGNVLTSGVSIPQSMDATFQNTQEFMRGITTPLPPSLMMYYLDQGWPSELVLMLFVREIRVYRSKDGAPHVVTNYPENKQSFDEFGSLVTSISNCDLDVEDEEPKAFGPALAASEVRTVKALVEARSASMVVDSVETVDSKRSKGRNDVDAKTDEPERFQLRTPGKGSHIVLKNREEGGCSWNNAQVRPGRLERKEPSMKKPDTFPNLEFVLRSPEAMVYYLGELARTQLDGQTDAGTTPPTVSPVVPQFSYHQLDASTKMVSSARILTVARGGDDGAAVVVNYDGDLYSIPSTGKGDQSTHVLSLVSQILAMQNKGSDLPGTATVHVVP